ncbi:MAG: cbb3-type cytochrome c oxidase subunit 3 [Ignavibacterium album]|jgi:cbb3-type cytochrome oxidase subunit 3|uniref:Cbb3-type cytochrome c oxidase subunit 3 n=1 Tax=Ignavibacterium album TaxID=591197 RepID=A0A7V3E7P6_9BACT|nr:cbb3-type cytochrome c oxidase subunit 3 [Ignavibacterium album]MCX8104798.1 cbb3-type cytochrome c oxidase subunit 3 [Ignavibacterium album]
MYKEILQSIEGVEIYPIISLIVFVVFFIVVTVWLIRMDKNYINEMKQLPLNNEDSYKLNSGELNEKHT